MNVKRVLLVYKKSLFQVYGREKRNRHFLRLVRSKHASTKEFRAAHADHYESLTRVKEVLKERGVETHTVYRAHPFSERGFDLVISVGGDGTFLEASHFVFDVPMLGVNSSPGYSVGFFCAATAGTLDGALDLIESGRFRPIRLARLRVKIGGKTVPVSVLNDVLFTRGNPAATVRYTIETGGLSEEHKSSGIWVSPPAGSSAAIRGAGGVMLPLTSRRFQYRVRELFQAERFRLRGGVLGPSSRLRVTSNLRDGRIYFDGPHFFRPFPLGAVAEVMSGGDPVSVFGPGGKEREKA